jgi:hypothetical protein
MMRISAAASLLAFLFLAGCSGVTTTLRYGADGQPETFIDCSNKPMARCYKKALVVCPQGYFLVEKSETPGGNNSGGIFGHTHGVGAQMDSTTIKFKNELVVRCKPDVPVPGQQAH